ncbi:hypothetical protein RN001_010259 [Aquatica leii]|uniref:Inositol-1-monophosphatase n=1 Tax=Aquatica leii TaxID=1421715 RepID=A0AAN7SN87_9COLE|nr:hypothetical protein RN001_010259 [Aquatica leii]
MVSDLDTYYNVALNLTKKAGQLIKERISEKKSVEIKSCDIDFVTETDRQVEQLLIKGLGDNFPEHKFIGEEGVSDGGQCNLTDAPTWIIDPIDGTLNFVHGFPHSCISLGLFINSQPEIGIIYNPMLEQLFTARKDHGAYLNGNPIRVSDHTDLSQAIIMFENGTSRDEERYKILCENHKMLVPIIHGMRSLGSAALNMMMVAMGGADAYFEFGIHIWDIAAGELIIKEAGGVVIDPSGGSVDRMSRRVLCASTQTLADQLSQKLIQYYPTPRD